MRQQKGFFRNIFEAMIESRSRQAAHELAQYRKLYRLSDEGASDKR